MTYKEKLFVNDRNRMHDIIKKVNRWLRTEKPNIKDIKISTIFGREDLLHGGPVANKILFTYTEDQEKLYVLDYVMDSSHLLPKLESKITKKMKKYNNIVWSKDYTQQLVGNGIRFFTTRFFLYTP